LLLSKKDQHGIGLGVASEVVKVGVLMVEVVYVIGTVAHRVGEEDGYSFSGEEFAECFTAATVEFGGEQVLGLVLGEGADAEQAQGKKKEQSGHGYFWLVEWGKVKG